MGLYLGNATAQRIKFYWIIIMKKVHKFYYVEYMTSRFRLKIFKPEADPEIGSKHIVVSIKILLILFSCVRHYSMLKSKWINFEIFFVTLSDIR
jgi:hypothetical protein